MRESRFHALSKAALVASTRTLAVASSRASQRFIRVRGSLAFTTILDFASPAASWAHAAPLAARADYLGAELAE